MIRSLRLLAEILCLIVAASALAGLPTLLSVQDKAPVELASSLNPSANSVEGGSEFLRSYRSDRSYSGLTLLPVEGGALIHLLNMQGRVVHSWNVDVERARLLPNCNLLALHGSKWGRYKKPWRGIRDRVIEYDWEGKPVWQYEASDVLHHDVHRLPNGHTLFLRRTMVPASFKETILDVNRRMTPIRGDSVLEVDSQGSIEWQWHAHEHLDLNSCGFRPCPNDAGSADAAKRTSDWTHLNTASIIPENKWFDAGDSRFRPGNVVILPRNWWEVIVIDRSSKKPVWRYRGDFRGGLGGGHEAHMIPKGLPGAGNMLIFDNGASVHPKESFALEVNPVSKKVVWHYESKDFFSATRGSLQRLPNGNTLISQDVSGRVFEVTRDGEIVWDYQSPKPINRARRYSESYCENFSQLRKPG